MGKLTLPCFRITAIDRLVRVAVEILTGLIVFTPMVLVNVAFL